MQTQNLINKLFKITCIALFAIMLPGFMLGQSNHIDIAVDQSTISESITELTYTFSIEEDATHLNDITIGYSVTGISTDEYTDPNNGSIQILAGSLSNFFTLTLHPDELVEAPESVTVEITSVDEGHLKSVSNYLQTTAINDDDIALLSISATSPISESGSSQPFSISTDKLIDFDVDISVTASGSATEGTDYASLSSPYTLSAKESSTSIDINVTADQLVEGNETIILTLTDPTETNVNLATSTDNLTITDDDFADFSLSESELTINEGSNLTFTVVLDAQPTSDVVIDLTSLDTDIATVSPSQLTFQNEDWNSPQTVTVTAVNEDKTITTGLTTSINVAINTAASNDAFDALDDKLVTINKTNNDGELTITASSDGTEGLSDASFTISTSLQLPDPTTITITTSSNSALINDDFTFGTITLPANTSSVNVPINIVNDNLVEGSETVTVTLDTEDNINAAIGTVNNSTEITITDNDDAEFSLSDPTLNINEGESATFTIVLTAQPTSNVLIDLSSDNTDIATVSPTQLTFTNGNWSDAQDVTVSCVNDDLTATGLSAGIVASINASSDSEFTELADKSVTINQINNDNAEYTLSQTTPLAINEGESTTFTIVLNAQPTNDVLIDLSSNNTDIATVSPTQLTFTNGNWSDAQDVTVNCVEDILTTTGLSTSVVASINASSDTDFTGLADKSVTINQNNNDGELTITEAATVDGEEGGDNGSFTINTSRQFPVPTTITVTTSSNSAVIDDDFTISTITLDANTSDVVVPLTIEDDDLAEGTETVTVTLNGVSGNSNAHIATSNNSTTISIADNDIPDIIINGGPFTIDEGSSGHTFDVGLAAQPLSNVVVDMSCVNPDISFSPSTLTFTNADWADKQVSFSASQDSDLISESDDISVTVDDANSDNAFDGLSKVIGLTVRDDDAAGIVTDGGPFTIGEGSTGHSFTVALAAQPASNVVVDIRSENADIIFSPTSVTFTNASWGTQTISFSASEDADLIDEMNPIIAEVNNASSDDAFDNQSAIINLTVTDNDQAELSISGTTNAEEDATSGAFTINASQATLGETEISLNISGSAIMGTDYETVNSTITMPDGSNSISIPINLRNDNLVEGLENITIELASVNNTKTSISGTSGSASIDIIDNDIADLVVSPTTFSVTEGTNDHSFNVALSAQPQSDVVVNLASNNTNISLSANTLTFTNTNYGNQTITFNCLEDDDLSDESANITIAVDNPSSNSQFYDLSSQITIDITDNDTQPEFTSNPITETNEDAVYTYNITVSDEDDDIPIITLITPADPNSTWLTLTDNNDGTAVLTGTPRQVDVTGSGSPIDVTIRAEDDLTSVEQSFTITVNNVNDSPQITNSTFSTRENEPLTIALSSFASDEDGNLNPSTLTVTSQPDHGSVNTDTPEEITYTPGSGFSGEDHFNVQIQDTNNAYSNVGTITITVSNEAPTANDDDYTTNEDEAILMRILDNDVDPQNNLNNGSLIVVDPPTIGTAEVNTTDGTITYTPNANENGDDSFTYRICDAGDYCDQATVNITITAVNDVPIVNDDNGPDFTLDEDTSLELPIFANDSDIDGTINPASINIVTNVTNGALTVNGNTITYTPNPDFNGTDNFVYTVEDNEGAGSGEATVTLTISPINDAPVAVDDEGTTSDIASIVINVIENDIDVDDNLDLASLSIIRQPVHGSVTINGTTGNITYEPDLNYYGSDTYQYQICDTDGECSTATVRLTVTTGNAKPNANTDYKSVDEDNTINFNPLENDNDPNFNLNFESLNIVEGPRFGTHQHATGSTNITYTPNSNYFGNDTIVYSICDLGNPPLCDQDTVFITVNPINDAPMAVDYHFDVIEGTPSTVNLVELGSDVEMEALTISITDDPSIKGVARVLADQETLEFTADIGSLCTSFELLYTLHDEQGGNDEATVYINVIPLDSDNDNIPDAHENPDSNDRDTDQDGTPDYLDDDSDGDGISDFIEGDVSDMCSDTPADTDGDGIPNYIDEDSDNDNIADKEEGIEDCDNDGTVNYIDSFDDCADRASIDVPETFTPNGDGINDYFIVKGATSDDLKENELFIFNRWGGQVYHMVNYDNTWDGKSNSGTLGSEELSEGTYFYVFKSKSGTLIKGTVYIKR